MLIIPANDVIATTVKEIGKQFREVVIIQFALLTTLITSKAFHVEETKRDVYNKVSSLEHIVESKGSKHFFHKEKHFDRG